MITDEQRKIIEKYINEPSDDIDSLLFQLDDKITEIGFNEEYDLNEDGMILQKLYDEIYEQN